MRASALLASAAVAAAIALPTSACTVDADGKTMLVGGHGRHAPRSMPANSGFHAGPALSGSWFDPARSGEGIVLELLPDGTAVGFWFTYPADGEAGEQAWLLASGGVLDGDTIRFDQVLRPQGARFGEAFDPASVQYEDWGALELQFASCDSATLRYSGPAGYGSGERTLSRLTVLDELDCSGQRELLPSGARALSGLQSRSGAWYVPSRSGEGWIVEQLPDGRSGVYWFTFDPQGRQAWMLGIGEQDGDVLRVDDLRIAGGTRFGDGFDAADVELRPWGALELHFDGCDGVQVSYAADDPAFGSASRDGARLATLASAPCIEQAPAAVTGGRWIERAPMPAPFHTEHSAFAHDGMIYLVGGFGAPTGFKRYDPQANSWTVLPAMPDARHHLAGFGADGGVYMVGGGGVRGSTLATSGYRYDLARGVWEPREELPFIEASHAAMLNGRAWIGDDSGVMTEYDPRTRQLRTLPMPPQADRRDHSQVVAFLGEIWWIGGRGAETNHVAIYDPVSGRWRAGPPLREARGGFAAAVAGNRIVVAGGEVIFGPAPYALSSSEIYGAGDDAWQSGPVLPTALHGVPAAAVGERLFVLGGSPIAGSVAGATGRSYELELEVAPAR